jgi:hypothetical protein
LGAFDHCSIALHGQSAFTSCLFRNAASAIVGPHELKCACLDCYVLNRMSALLPARRGKRYPLRAPKIGLRSDQILFRFLSRWPRFIASQSKRSLHIQPMYRVRPRSVDLGHVAADACGPFRLGYCCRRLWDDPVSGPAALNSIWQKNWNQESSIEQMISRRPAIFARNEVTSGKSARSSIRRI